MADEITYSVNLIINKRSTDGLRQLIDFNGRRTFRSDMSGGKGPLPGSLLVPLTGVDVDLSQLTDPGPCWVENQGRADGVDIGSDPSIYYIDVGVKETSSGLFFPLLELWPGDAFPLRLSRNLFESYNSTGTGTGAAVNTLHMISHYAACIAWVGAFER